MMLVLEEAMANRIHKRQLTIEWGHCDPAGIVLKSRLCEYVGGGAWEMFEAVLGVPRAELFATYDIMGIPLVDARARFLLPVRFGDRLEVASEVSEFRRSSFDMTHRMSVNGELAVEGRETRGWATRDKDDPPRIRATPLPPGVVERVRAGAPHSRASRLQRSSCRA